MMILTIENGVVRDAAVGEVPILTRLVESSGAVSNVRTHMPLAGPIGVTIHNTANAAPTADALAHAAWLQSVENADSDYIGAHFFVDAVCIVQTLPLNEVSWHAGDGNGRGNMATISIEICENDDLAACEANAMTLAAALLDTYGLNDLYTHQMWSGKYCPHCILDRAGGWADFVSSVATIRAAASQPPMAAPVVDNTPSSWAQEAVDWALAHRFLVGDENGDYALHRAATREECIVFLHRWATNERG